MFKYKHDRISTIYIRSHPQTQQIIYNIYTLKHYRKSATYILSNNFEYIHDRISTIYTLSNTIEYLQYTHFQTRSNIYNVYTLKMIEYIYKMYILKLHRISTLFIPSNMTLHLQYSYSQTCRISKIFIPSNMIEYLQYVYPRT